MSFLSNDFPRLRTELDRAFDDLNRPKQPKRIYACTTANRPAAADFKYCLLFDTTLSALKVSDGTNWV